METLVKTMMAFAIMENEESQSQKVEEFAVLLMCWHMRQSMLAWNAYLKKLWSQQQILFLKHTISFPNTMPPWLEDEDEEDEYYD
jgi:hypothetical protein